MNLPNLPNPRWITTADKVEVTTGDRVCNYYDGEWGVIGRIDDQAQPDTLHGQDGNTPHALWTNYWFEFTSDDGRKSTLDGSRISTVPPRGHKNAFR